MATNYIWKVQSLITNPNDDNFITEATAKVFGTEGTVTKATDVSCKFEGNKASVGADFKSLEDLKKAEGEAIIIGWIKTGIMDYKVKIIEQTVQDLIDIHNKKVLNTNVVAADTAYSAQPTVTVTPEE